MGGFLKKSGASGRATWRSCADFRKRSRHTCVADSAGGFTEKTGDETGPSGPATDASAGSFKNRAQIEAFLSVARNSEDKHGLLGADAEGEGAAAQRSLFPGQLCALLQSTTERWAQVVAPQVDLRPVERPVRALRRREAAER
eukprot:5940588-Pyramimonas_sp.AAC.1